MSEHKGDLISRRALRDKCNEIMYTNPTTNVIMELIDNAPTFEYPFYQEAYQTGYEEGLNARPKGKWVKDYTHEEHGETSIVCSICSYSVPNKSNFCPNCGADMRKGG